MIIAQQHIIKSRQLRTTILGDFEEEYQIDELWNLGDYSITQTIFFAGTSDLYTERRRAGDN